MLDLCIANGTIIDGSGQVAYCGSIGIKGNKIVECVHGFGASLEARRVIDAAGKCVTPGFVDTHTHSDLMLLWDRQHASALHQGVTTEIIGQDGMSYAPMSTENIKTYARYAQGCNGLPRVGYQWNSVAQYLEEFRGCGINIAYLMPHCALRMENMGMARGNMNEEQMTRSLEMIRCAMAQGAKGLSTGLSYLPNFFSSTQEITQFCKEVARQSGVFAIHLRTVFCNERFDAVDEALRICLDSGVKLHFSHFKTGVKNAGKSMELMEKIDCAAKRGLSISLELYPYAFGASLAQMFLPYWTLEKGQEQTLEYLGSEKIRKQIAAEMDATGTLVDGVFSYLRKNEDYIGQSFSEVALLRRQTMGEMLCDLLNQEELCIGFYDKPLADAQTLHRIDLDMLELIKRPYYMVGSDAILMGDTPHPRAFGCFAKMIRLAVENDFSLPMLINRMTKTPCERFGIEKRGELKTGNFADVVIFDAAKVREKAEYGAPRRAPEGIETVLVNGKIAVEDGHVTGIFNGRPV